MRTGAEDVRTRPDGGMPPPGLCRVRPVREQPEQQAPPVQRLRIRYAKRGRLRFTSHRDFSRAFERAVMRARIPMAYSSGFHPHPRISYAGAAPTGAASEAEYLEIGLREVVDPAAIRASLEQSLPDGLDVVGVVVSPGGALADRLVASRWLVQVPPAIGVASDPGGQATGDLEGLVATFLATEEVLVERMTKKGMRQFDCRAAVVSLTVIEDPAGMDLVLRHTVPAVRPDDVLTGLAQAAGLERRTPIGTALVTRLAQGPLDEATGDVGDPLA